MEKYQPQKINKTMERKAKLIKTDVNYLLENCEGVVIASTSTKEGNNKLSKQNCDELFGVVDVEKLAKSCIKHIYNKYGENITSSSQKLDTIYGYKSGFNKCMELNKDKGFTLEDMKRAFKVGFSNGFASDIISQDKLSTEKENLFNEFIQSIQQPNEIEVEIKMYTKRRRRHLPERVPLLDSEECLILKRI
jgi:hypothetical protein